LKHTVDDIARPIKFRTIYKEKLWGGHKIKTILNKDYGDLPNCGETWEISGVEGNISVVDGGIHQGKSLIELIEQYKGDLLGEQVYQQFGINFPLLIKFIDANQDLSIQVHPEDNLAKKRHNSSGKTEMWYVVQADENSSLISGFNQEVDKEKYLHHLNNGKLNEILNTELAQDDDVFFLPAGRVHTIGKGLLIAEIQQTSDITYRIYDFDRKDANGNLRKLHTEEALDAIDYQHYSEYKTRYSNQVNHINQLVDCDYFVTNQLELTEPMKRDYSGVESFRILIFLEGEAKLSSTNEETHVVKGDVFLIPAKLPMLDVVPMDGPIKLLETYLPTLKIG